MLGRIIHTVEDVKPYATAGKRERQRECCIQMRSLFGNVMVWMWLCVGIGALASEVLSLKALAAAEKYKASLKDPLSTLRSSRTKICSRS